MRFCLPLSALLLAFLAGCGGGVNVASTLSEAPRHTALPARDVVTKAVFSDMKPHPWDRRPPLAYPVHGIDVARFQTEIDWRAARANGVNFAFIKATEGGDLVDPMFSDHWRNAGRVGMRRGAYHFYYHCRAPEEQARWFFRHVPRTPGALPPVIDMEWTPFSPTCTIRREAAVIRADAAVLIRMFTEHYGTAPILYTTVDFFEDNEMWRLKGVDFWLRSVSAHPSDRYNGHHWTFWQYSATGLVPGIRGEVDINVFAGSEGSWGEWLVARAQ